MSLTAAAPAHRAETTADTLWVWFYRSLPVLVLAMVLLGIIR